MTEEFSPCKSKQFLTLTGMDLSGIAVGRTVGFLGSIVTNHSYTRIRMACPDRLVIQERVRDTSSLETGEATLLLALPLLDLTG